MERWTGRRDTCIRRYDDGGTGIGKSAEVIYKGRGREGSVVGVRVEVGCMVRVHGAGRAVCGGIERAWSREGQRWRQCGGS